MAQAKRTTPAKYRRRSAPGLKGVSFNAMKKDVLTPAGFLIGIVVGKVLHDSIDGAAEKVGAISGLAGDIKSAVKPALLVGAGLAAKQMVKGDFQQAVAYGVASYGGISLAKDYLNFDVLKKLAPGSDNGDAGVGTIPFRYFDNPGYTPDPQFTEEDFPLGRVSQ